MPPVPVDFSIRSLLRLTSERGTLFEGYRASWSELPAAEQWNVVDSVANVMRGMHAHLGYDEFYLLLAGTARLGLCDTRPGSPTEGATLEVALDGAVPQLVTMPRGIMHGIYSETAGRLLVGMNREWDGSGQTGCHWSDPELGLSWKLSPVQISAEDDALPPLREVRAMIPRFQPRPAS
ncbi:MAG TPA: dTDP-4-dehydrorhamnose 3,5-epimerase family protein [Opitutus sp.]|nr:dTDP-4-dehydrorhamnose 3,5-epimerase family protein [Opitutus sp.]